MPRKQSSFGYLLATCIIASANGVHAQSITTGANGLNTNVDQVGNQYNITGGTQAGGNLFYSLQKLGLSSGEIANFLSNPNVQNVLTRVTGGEASLINGLIQVTGGNSNLFIMNPAGIVFGANASLNVPASFSATTASGIQVGNGWFGINSSVDEVRNLTGNITGYAFTNTLPSVAPNPSGVILNEGNLNVSAGKSVTLVGGMVVNTGTIATPSGNITIAATPDNKFIKITSEGSLISLELPIADRQAVGNAPVLKGVDLPSLLTGKTAGTAIASAQVGDVIVEDAFIRAGTVNLHATNNLGVSNSWVIGTDKLTATGNNITVKNAIFLAKDATVVAKNNLNIAESLVRTTENLTLQANNVVTMRDSVKTPLIISAGGNLKIQGSNAIDIFALNHYNTIKPFISGGNLDLISNGNVSFDAHSYSGGGFSIKKLDGALGKFFSLFDPIISSNGDVTFGDYTGVSLKVETKGSITAGNIYITGPDVGLVGTDTDIPTLTSSASLILRAGLATLQNTPSNAPQTSGGATFTFSNSSFELGNLTGWTTIGGNISVVGTTNGVVPTQGAFQAFLNRGNGATDNQVESFLGIPAGGLDALGGNATGGSAIKTTFTGTAGQTIAIDWTYRDFDPGLNDFAFAVLNNNVQQLATNASAAGKFSRVLPTSGTYTLALGIMNRLDNSATPALYVDNFVSNPATITVGNITTEGGPVILTAPGTITTGTITIKTPVVIQQKPNIDPNKETRRHDEKKELGLSSLTPVAFLSSDDIELQRLDRFLILIVELMNKDGGDLAIDAKDIWKDADIKSSNQDVIKLAIRRSIGKFIGNEFIDLVDVNFETKKDKKTILLKVRKSPKTAKFLKD